MLEGQSDSVERELSAGVISHTPPGGTRCSRKTGARCFVVPERWKSPGLRLDLRESRNRRAGAAVFAFLLILAVAATVTEDFDTDNR